ncbi:MAG: carbon-nitrogen hydrolase family protein [Candidatus Promineifilaceae bacterium]
MSNSQITRVAVVQAAPVLFDREKTIDKACDLIAETGRNGAQLALFPEAFVPAYPRGLSFGMVVGSRNVAGRDLWELYWENGVDVPSAATEKLGKAARDAGVFVAMGVIERDSEFSGGTLFCTTLYFGADGTLLGKHRKLKPTGSERLIWGEGDGSTLTTLDTDMGKVGGLICWENYMPLARMAMYAKGVELYLAPTADSRDEWQSTMQHIALEGRCFVLGCNQFITKAMYPEGLPMADELNRQPDIMCRGGSVIISPLGKVLAGPLYNAEGILYADLNRREIARGKLDFDVMGHYARPDVFQLTINEQPQRSARFV